MCPEDVPILHQQPGDTLRREHRELAVLDAGGAWGAGGQHCCEGAAGAGECAVGRGVSRDNPRWHQVEHLPAHGLSEVRAGGVCEDGVPVCPEAVPPPLVSAGTERRGPDAHLCSGPHPVAEADEGELHDAKRFLATEVFFGVLRGAHGWNADGARGATRLWEDTCLSAHAATAPISARAVVERRLHRLRARPAADERLPRAAADARGGHRGARAG